MMTPTPTTPRIGPSSRARRRIAPPLLVAFAMLAASGLAAAPAQDDVRASFRRVLTAPEARARMTILRSDPFGGAPSRERGSLWLIPGRGLRYKSAEPGGQELVIDRTRGVFLLYSASESMVFRAPYERAPARLRRLVAEPDRFLSADLTATPERRRVGGALQNGYRIRSGSLGDERPEVSIWMAREGGSGLPKTVLIASQSDTVTVEFRNWQLSREAKPADLELTAPPGTPEAPLDPRELLERGNPWEEDRETR